MERFALNQFVMLRNAISRLPGLTEKKTGFIAVSPELLGFLFRCLLLF